MDLSLVKGNPIMAEEISTGQGELPVAVAEAASSDLDASSAPPRIEEKMEVNPSGENKSQDEENETEEKYLLPLQVSSRLSSLYCETQYMKS
jgi:hypothetical protein